MLYKKHIILAWTVFSRRKTGCVYSLLENSDKHIREYKFRAVKRLKQLKTHGFSVHIHNKPRNIKVELSIQYEVIEMTSYSLFYLFTLRTTYYCNIGN